LDNTKEKSHLRSNTSNFFWLFLVISGILSQWVSVTMVYSQDINFGSFYSTFTPELWTERALDFGNVIAGEDETIDINSMSKGVVSITGIRFLDVIVDITPFPVSQLYLDGDDTCNSSNCQLPLTLSIAYTNQGQAMDDVSGAVVFTGGTARFPIRARTSMPPGPPPTPNIVGQTPAQGTAYLYFYGMITSTNSNLTGSYSRIITVSVTYN
jgi:hypothetical protein